MPAARNSFWATVTRFDAAQLAPVMALRNALGVGIALFAGIVLGNAAGGVLAATGALDVAFSDGSDPYLLRGRRMLTAALFVALAVFAGRLCGHNHALAITLEAACAFAAGLMVAVGRTPADIGTITLVTLIVFAASPASFGKALSSGLLALAGGVMQTVISLALWPVRRYAPESSALGDLYAELARSAAQGAPATESPPATEPIVTARAAVAGLAGDRAVEAERYLALYSQAERIRLGLLTLSRLRTRLAREPDTGGDAALLARCLTLAAQMLESVGASLRAGEKGDPHTECLAELSELAGSLRTPLSGAPASVAAMRNDARWQLDALAGQLRTAVELAAHATPAGQLDFEREQAGQPWILRVAGALAVLRANLSLNSAALRHAVRLSACVALADASVRSLAWHRAYWAPMTVVIVLKPDFTATFSRGVLRLAGTFGGLAIATGIFHLLAPPPPLQAALITVFQFAMRWAGAANYGLLVTALTSLVVFLFALSGTPPAEVISARALNTIAGGAIALAAYRLWPTWEREHISAALATLLDAYRDYFQAVRDAYVNPGLERQGDFAARLSRVRQAGRLARTNLEASAARVLTEPGAEPARITAMERILANSHRLIHAMMSLESGLYRSRPVPARAAFAGFANGVDATLYFLSAYLRGSPAQPSDLPDLREAHHALAASGDSRVERYALVNVETDRITNSANTLAGEIRHWVGSAPLSEVPESSH